MWGARLPMQIPLVDLQAQSWALKPEIMSAIEGVLEGMLPVTEAVTEHIVSLPMYPELTSEQMQMVVNAVKRNTVQEVPSL